MSFEMKEQNCDSHVLMKERNGAYTTMRTMDSKIFCLDQHIERLCFSFNNIFKKEKFLKVDFLRMELLSILKLYRPILKKGDETKIIVLVSKKHNNELHSQKDVKIKTLLTILKPKSPINVFATIVQGSRVHFNEIKDLGWVKEREKLSKMEIEGSEDCLLLEENGVVREGLSSNFFVVKKDKEGKISVITSNEHVLFGTMRKIALEACKELNYTIILDNPNFNNIDDWKECFISSTSRYALPISKLFYNKKLKKEFDSSISKGIRKKVIKLVKKYLTKI